MSSLDAVYAGKSGTSKVDESSPPRAARWQQSENTLIAVGIVLAVMVWGQPWWALLLAFLAFDLSALGYLVNRRVGAFCYNLVHNYTAPAALAIGWVALQNGSASVDWVVMFAACWGFHVAVDRALGFGLKLGPFSHTHLGIIGRTRHTAS